MIDGMGRIAIGINDQVYAFDCCINQHESRYLQSVMPMVKYIFELK